MRKKHIKQAMKHIARKEIKDDMDIWMNIESQIQNTQLKQHVEKSQDIFAPLKRVMAGLVMDPTQPRRYSGITFAVSIAVTALVLVIIVAIGTQPSGDTSLSVQPVPVQQNTEVDCLADRAYRVVYAEELPGLTTEDLKCAFIVGDMRGLDISHLDFSDTVMRDVNMSGMELERAFFRRAVIVDADLSDAKLTSANFSNASLVNIDLSLSDLTRASFIDTNLNKADLRGATMTSVLAQGANLRQANLSCADDLVMSEGTPEATESVDEAISCKNPAVVSRANLREATLFGADLTQADLSNANMESAYLDSANLQRANMEQANLVGAKLYDTKFQNARLAGAILDFADLFYTNLDGADLSNTSAHIIHIVGEDCCFGPYREWNDVNFSKTDGILLFWDMKIKGADFSDAILDDLSLGNLELLDSNFSGATMQRSAFIVNIKITESDFTNTNLSRADLNDVDFTGSDFTGADFTGAAFTDVVWTDVTLPDGSLWTEGTDLTRFTDANHADYWRSDDPESPAYGEE